MKQLGAALKAGLVLGVPIAVFGSILVVYQKSTYTFVADIQGASIAFIPIAIGVVILSIFCFRNASRRLNSAYTFSSSLLRFGSIVSIGLCITLFGVLTGGDKQTIEQVAYHSALFTVSSLGVTAIVFVLITLLLQQLEKMTTK